MVKLFYLEGGVYMPEGKSIKRKLFILLLVILFLAYFISSIKTLFWYEPDYELVKQQVFTLKTILFL